MKIDSIESQSDDILYITSESIKFIKDELHIIKKMVVNSTFNSQKDEVHFFKEIKPKIYSKLIYNLRLFNIESKRPRGSAKSQRKYIDKEIKRLQNYFNDNLEFYHYYRRGATFLDEQYFMRGKADIYLCSDTFHCFIDEQFSTTHDSTVATILAYDMLIVYLKTEIDKLRSNNGMEITNSSNSMLSSKLFWTGSKTDLIELIYALDSSGAINSGTADIKEVAAVYEQIFNIDLGNYYHTFIEIRARKSKNTKFIDKLKESLIKRFKESDKQKP